MLGLVLHRIGQQRWLQVVVAEQLADRLEVVQQVRGLLWRFWSVHRGLRVAVNGGLAEDSPVRGRNGNSPARLAGCPGLPPPLPPRGRSTGQKEIGSAHV